MGGMKFEYDEEGGTFYYFLLSFIALILFPATYYLWPRKQLRDMRLKSQCYCHPCQSKRKRLKTSQPRENFNKFLIKCILGLGWILFFFVAYKTTQVKLDFKEFDPYAELEIDRGASTADIRKAYRRLSLIYHPDRETGDSHRFMKITKAHDALTDDEARKNWEEYGNPDGPGATQVGIALPKWIVEKQNSIWVLGVYALIFMVILPVCVGTWWYRSIKYSAQQVLIETSKMYYHALRKSPNMILKRVIMVVAGSYEFCRQFNSEIIERPSDNIEIPNLIRDLPQFIQNNREFPFFVPYAVKARALLIAHFSRKDLISHSLEIDQDYILKKCPYLLTEILSIAQQLYFISQAERIPYKLSLDTVDNIMRSSQMIVQAVWSTNSPLLQLPHLTEEMMRHFVTKKRNIRSIKQFACMKEEERRLLLRQLSDSEYLNVMNVCQSMPYDVDLHVRCEVKGEEDKTVTAGSLVTVSVRLIRHNRVNLPLIDTTTDINSFGDGELEGEQEEGDEEENEDANQTISDVPSKQVQPNKWLKIKKKKGGAKKSKLKKIGSNKIVIVKKIEEESKEVVNADEKKDKEKLSRQKNGGDDRLDAEAGGSSAEASDVEHSSADESPEIIKNGTSEVGSGGAPKEDDEDEWMAFQHETRKENALETKSKETHSVHCPYYPTEKFEWWWLYLADLKNKHVLSGPIQITTLKEEEEKDLRFTAPSKPCQFHFSVVLRSDSYLGVDQVVNVKLDVKEARKIEEPKWESSDEDAENKADADTESDASSNADLTDDE